MVDGEIIAGDASCKVLCTPLPPCPPYVPGCPLCLSLPPPSPLCALMKVPKLVKLGNGGQYKKFLYSVMNCHGQIVGFWFVDQDSAECLKPMFDEVNARSTLTLTLTLTLTITITLSLTLTLTLRFEKHGGPPPILAFGDNCCGADRSMFQGSFPSLKGGMVAQDQRAAAETAKVSKLPNATLHNLDFETKVRIIKTWEGAGNLGSQLLMNTDVTVIGLDAEWTPEAQGSRVDVLQLGVPGGGRDGKGQAFILHLSHVDMKPPNGER